jgi:hypothetical protein
MHHDQRRSSSRRRGRRGGDMQGLLSTWERTFGPDENPFLPQSTADIPQ